MELKFNFDYNRFSEFHSNKDDFDVETDTITSYHKESTKPPTIQIKIEENDPNNFLNKDTISPKIKFYEESAWVYFPIEKIKNKIK